VLLIVWAVRQERATRSLAAEPELEPAAA